MMLSATQQTQLETMVQNISTELHIEAATLDPQHILELTLCRDFVCFRPLRVGAQEVDILAALNGEAQAQGALQERLKAALQELL